MIDFETIEVNQNELKNGDFVFNSDNEVVQYVVGKTMLTLSSNPNLFYADGALPSFSPCKKIIGPKESLDLLKLGK
jgi:hypothetical protein